MLAATHMAALQAGLSADCGLSYQPLGPTVTPKERKGCWQHVTVCSVTVRCCVCCVKEAELDRLRNAREAENVYQREQNELEVTKTRELADIETGKFKNMVDAIGAATLQAIATAGPDMQVSAVLMTVQHVITAVFLVIGYIAITVIFVGGWH